jgi:integrase/recombinase XerC
MARGSKSAYRDAEVTPEDCRGFVDHLLRTRAPATAHNRFRFLKTFFAWSVKEGELPHSPMAIIDPPHIPEVPIEIVTEEQMRELVKVCSRRRDSRHRRDEAIIRLFYDTGIRRNELADSESQT